MSASVTHPAFSAFISYSHRDTRAAKWLHRRLEAFRIDKDLIGRTTPMGAVPQTLRPVFRDRSDFDAGSSLAAQTAQALDNSAAMVVLASPDAARSDYVNEEVRQFRQRHPDRPVIPLIVAGPPRLTGEDVFPRSLRFEVTDGGAMTGSPTELLAADARRAGDGPDLALAKVVARLLGLAPDEVFRRAERERRKRNRLRTALGAAMVVLAVAGGFFAWRTHDQGQALAEVAALVRQYQPVASAQAAPAARDSLTAALTAIVQGAATDPRYAGALELLKAGRPEEAEPLLRQSAEDMAARARHDAGQAAAAYRNLGAIAGLADPKRAREAYDKAAALDPDNIDGLSWAGWFDLDARDLTGAERWYRRLLSLPEAQRDSDTTVWAHLGLGDIAAGRGRLDAALSDYQEARAAIDRLAKADPNNAGWQHDLGISNERVGGVLVAQGNLPAALSAYQTKFAIIDRLAKADPNNAGWQRDLSLSYNKTGDVLVAQGNLPAALQSFRDSLAIRDRLAKADPDNAGWQRNLSVSYNRIGDVLVAQGNLSAALQSFHDGLAIADRLARADPDNAGWQRDLSVSYNKVGDVLVAQGDLPAALQSFSDGLAIAGRLAKADPNNAG